jgi:hypothetical protein
MQSLILSVGAAFYFTALVLYHLMVFRVNKNLPREERIPHSLTFGQRDRLSKEYRALYPRSILYPLALACAITVVALALAFAGVRIWDAARGG